MKKISIALFIMFFASQCSPKVYELESIYSFENKIEGKWEVLSKNTTFCKDAAAYLVFEDKVIKEYNLDSVLILQSHYFIEVDTLLDVVVINFAQGDIGCSYTLEYRCDSIILKDASSLVLGDTLLYNLSSNSMVLGRQY